MPRSVLQFLQFRMKIINLKLDRFRDRVEFSGNPSKYDVSVTLRSVQLEDEGIYNCYVTNPPDRHRGHGKIYLQVLLEGEEGVGSDPLQSQLGVRGRLPTPEDRGTACAEWKAPTFFLLDLEETGHRALRMILISITT